MSVENIRKLLGSLQDDPEDEKAWSTLEERAISGELAEHGEGARRLLEEARTRLLERGEAEAVARLLDVEVELSATAAEKLPLLRERARLLENELLDDRAAIATLDRLLALGSDPEAAEKRDELGNKKARWKEVAAAYKSHAENDSTDPTLIASHLVSAAGVVLQYKGKGRDKESDAIFEQALAVDPGNVRAIQVYERVLRRRGNRWDDLAALLERGASSVADRRTRTDLLFRAARTHAARRSDIAAAERIYRQILELEPGQADATRFVVAILTDREAWGELAAFYESQLAVRPEDLGLLVQAGMTHWRMRRNVAAAAPFFRRIQALQPDHAAAAIFVTENPGALGALNTDDDEVAIDAGGEEEIDESVVAGEHAGETEVVRASGPMTVPAPPPESLLSASRPPVEVPVAEQLVGDEQTVVTIPLDAEAADAPVVDAPVEAVAAAAEGPREFIRDSMLPGPSSVPAPRIAAPKVPTTSRVQQSVDVAQAAEASGQVDRAIEAWKMVLRQEPTHPDARPRLATLYQQAGRWNNLVELHRQELDSLGGVRPGPSLAEHRERKLEILRQMVAIYRDKMNLEPMVVQTWSAILTLEPSDRAALVALAASYEKLGRYTDVIKVLEQQAEHADDLGERVALLRRVASLWIERFNNVNNATRPLEQIVAADPTNAEAIGQLKDLYNRRRAWRPLFEISRREVDLLTGAARRDAIVELARLAMDRLASPAESIALWREALTLDSSTPGALDALEKLTERERDYAGLADVLERRAEEVGDAEARLNALMKLGAVYSDRLSDTARSVDAWRRVLSTRPGHPKAMRVLRDAYTQSGAWDELEALYASANDYEGLAEVFGAAADRSTDPSTKISLSFRAAGIYVDQLAQPERAFRSYERVLAVDSRNLRAAEALVPIYLKDEKWPRLAQLYEILLDALPAGDTARALDYLQRLRELAATRLGDRPGAFRWALRAYRIAPADSDLESALERAAAESGAWRELVEAFDAHVADAPESDRARLRDKCATIEADRLNLIDAAIARYQSALVAHPEDPQVIATLDRLLRRGARWAELRSLYDHRLGHTADGAQRRALRLEVARLEEQQLGSRAGASERLRAMIADDPDDVEALESLSRLAELDARWDELAALVDTRRAAASGGERAELAFRLGQLRAERLGDAVGAIASFREVLDLVPHHPGTLAALEAMLADEGHRVEVARLLEPEFEAVGEYKKFAWTLQILHAAETDAPRRRSLALRLAEVYAGRLGDGQSGFELLGRMLDEQPGSEEIAEAFTTLAIRGGWTEDLARALASVTNRGGIDPEVRVALARRTAAVYDDRLGNAAAAEPFHRLVIDSGALDLHAFGALKRHFQHAERWSDLRSLYATWVERSPEIPSKIELLAEEALIVEEVLDQSAEAAEVYLRILALDETNRPAARALDRLWVRLGRWRDLESLLRRSADLARETSTDEAREYLFRRGELRERHLDDAAGALDDFEFVLEEVPTHPEARAGIERLLAVPALRQRAAAALEPRYEADGDAGAAHLARMLAVRLEFTPEARDRAALHQRIAELRELVLDDVPGAFDALVSAVREDPASESLRAELLRLSAVAATDARAAATLERAVEDLRTEHERIALLRDLATLYDERLGDARAAERTWRRVLAVGGDDPEVSVAAAISLERLYRGLGEPKGLVDALALRARFEGDADARRALLAQSAEILEDELQDHAAAISAHRARLEIDANDRDALASLQRLFERTAQWGELVGALRADAAVAVTADDQKALLLRAAAVLEDRMADIAGAIAVYSEVLDSFGPDRGVHASLARLYELSDAWSELLATLERDLAVADEGDRLAIIVRVAELRRTRTGDLARAVEGYREALEIDLAHPAAREALWALLGSTEPGVALASARALDPVLQGEGAWERLVVVLDRIAADSDDPDESRRVLARAAEVSEIGIGDSSRAFDYASRELRASLGESDLRGRIDHVETLARASHRQTDLFAVLRDVAPELLDADLQRDVAMRVATLARTSLENLATARSWYERALEIHPDYAPALDALASLHAQQGAWPELLAVLRQQGDLAEGAEARRNLLRRQAEICETKLDDLPAAMAAHEAILGMRFDAQAAHALERLYAQTHRWEDLAALLETQLSTPGADEVDLYHRLGLVAMDHLNAPERALDHLREALARRNDHEATIAALERLGQREGLAAPVAETLEPIYLARVEWPKLIAAVEARIAAEGDVAARKELLARLGTIYEENLGDLGKALETYARMFREEIADRATWEVLSRLARQLGRWDRLTEIYRAALEEISIDDEVSADLAFITAQVLDERVHDTASARRYFNRALGFDPTRAEVFRAFEALLKRESSHGELLALYRDAADRAGDVAERKGFQFQIAEIDEHALNDLARAIDDYRAILETDPADVEAVKRLDELLSRTASWQDLADLLDRRVQDAIDSDERTTLRFRLGRLRADKLDDPRGAVEAFREIVEERRDHAEAIRALEGIADAHPTLRLGIVEILEPIYRDLDDWNRLVVALNIRIQASTDLPERTQFLREVGSLKETRARDARGAFAAYAQAFTEDPGDGEAREALERLAAEHNLWDDLVRAYEAAVGASDDLVVRTDLLRAVAQTHDQRRDDPRAAIDAYNRLFALDDSQVDVLDLLEGLHVLLSDWQGHVDVLERKVARSLDDEHRKFLLHTIGDSQRDMLGDLDAAIDAYRRALETDATDAIALDALDGLYTQRGDAPALGDVLARRLDIEGDAELRRQTALRLGKLWETELGNLEKAIDAYRRALDDAPTDGEAIAALERLYTHQESWAELLENLRTQVALATEASARTSLLLRVGDLLAGRLGEPDQALESYREVLDVDPANANAIRAVKELARNEAQRATAVEILEPIFRAAARWTDLVETLELKLGALSDPPQRLEELRGLAQVHENGRNDLATAFDTLRRALREDASDRGLVEDLERLAAPLNRWGDVVDALEREAEDATDTQVVRDLSVRAAEIAVERLADDPRATRNYRRALEQTGDDDAILAPLDAIFTRGSQWRELLDVLDRRVSAAAGDELDALEVRVAALREQRFDDAPGALTAFRNVVERTPTHAEAIAGLERMVENQEVRGDALDVLEAAFQRNGDHPRLARIFEARVAGADLATDRVRLLGDLARLREERLGDLGRALDAWVDAFRTDPGDDTAIVEIERLAPASGSWARLSGVVEDALAAHPALGPTEQSRLNLRAARWYRDHLDDTGRAEARLLAVLVIEPESQEALEMLEGLRRAPGRERDLVATLRRRAELEFDPDTRRRALREAAELAEHRLGDVDQAAEIVTALLDADDADVDALDALARFRRAQGRHTDLAEALARRARLTDDPTRAAALRREVAEIFAGPANDTDRAILAYRDLLDFDPVDLGARAALEGLFERDERWKDLEETLRGRLDIAVSAEERAETRMRLAKLVEDRFHNLRDAAEYLREVLDETPTHAAAGRELERIYTAEARWPDLAELLERRAEDLVATGDSTGELATLVRIGELNERELRDPAKAIELYERVLDRDPDHVGALQAVARIAEREQQWDRAADMLRRGLSLAPAGTGADLALRLARIEDERLDDRAAAAATLRAGLDREPAHLESIEWLRRFAERTGDAALLAFALERELATQSEARAKVATLRLLAQLHRERLGQPAHATAFLEDAHRLVPEDREVAQLLLEAYESSGRQADAVPILNAVIASFGTRRTKELANWQHRLGRALEASGDLSGALAQFDTASRVDPTSVPILRDLGLICLRTGDFERAQKTFRVLLLQRLDVAAGISKADVYFYLGDTLAQQGDKPKAISMLERALEAERGHLRAAELVARLKA